MRLQRVAPPVNLIAPSNIEAVEPAATAEENMEILINSNSNGEAPVVTQSDVTPGVC